MIYKGISCDTRPSSSRSMKSKTVWERLSPQAQRRACWPQQWKNGLMRPEQLAHILW